MAGEDRHYGDDVSEFEVPWTQLGTQGSNVAPLPTRVGPVDTNNFLFNDLNRYYQQRDISIVTLDAVTAIEMDVDNILECPVGSFMFNRAFGSRLKSFLFEPMNVETAAAIKIYLIEAISQWEPRVYVNLIDTYVVPDYDGGISGMPGYYVRIVYVIRANGAIKELIRALPTQTGQ